MTTTPAGNNSITTLFNASTMPGDLRTGNDDLARRYLVNEEIRSHDLAAKPVLPLRMLLKADEHDYNIPKLDRRGREGIPKISPIVPKR